jgi:lipopolysaccharide export system permease protein
MNTLIGVTIVLLLAFLSQQVVRYLNFVAIGKIPTNVLLQLVGFEVPYILSFLLPLGLYLGILLAYGRLYADNEMSILQMYGYGNKRIMRLTLCLALVVAVIVFCLMMWVNPLISAKRQQVMASDEATLHLVETLIPGRFQVSPDGHHVMYVEKLSRDHQRAENIFLAQEKKIEVDDKEQKTWMLISAKEGYQTKDPDSKNQFFVTANGYRYEGVAGHNDYKVIQFGKYAVRIPEPEAHITHEINETLSLSQLWHDYSMPKRAAELQWRFSLVILTFLLAVLAVPLSTIRPRQGRYFSLIPAVLIYVIYVDVLFIARHWVSQSEVPIAIGMWWVHAVMFLFVCAVLLFNAKPWANKR